MRYVCVCAERSNLGYIVVGYEQQRLCPFKSLGYVPLAGRGVELTRKFAPEVSYGEVAPLRHLGGLGCFEDVVVNGLREAVVVRCNDPYKTTF